MKHHVLLCIKDFRSGLQKNKHGLPFKSGAEFHAERHAEELVRQGHDVTIFAKKRCWNIAGYEKINGYALHRLLPGIRAFQLITLLLASYRKGSVMHLLGKPDFAAFAIPVAQWLGISVCFELTIVGEVFTDRPKGFFATWREAFFRRCDVYLANTEEIAHDLASRGIPKEKIIQHPQGIDISRFHPVNHPEKIKLREKLNLPVQGPVLLFCCRIVHRKGIDLVLDAWPKVKKQCPECKLLLVGGGETQWVQRITDSMKKDTSIYYTGEVTDPVPYYQASDIYLFPSRREGLPTSLMEAMSCSLAPVVSAIGGNVDLVKDEIGTGMLCQSGDAESLAEKINQLLSSGEQGIRKMGEAARAYAERELDRRVLVKTLVNIYDSIQNQTRLEFKEHTEKK